MLPDAAVEDIFEDLIEEAADSLLDQYSVFAGELNLPVPVESIAEHFLKYDIDITDEGLFSDPAFLGGISFESNTIFVNASIEGHEGRYNFTIAHEIGHHVLHRELYDDLITDKSKILCREEKVKPLIERQADRFAAALMMPKHVISEVVSQSGFRSAKTLGEAIRLASVLQKSHGFTNVSMSAIVNRLKDLKLVDGSIPYQTGNRWRSPRSWNPIAFVARRLKRILKRIV